jgi:hypothetical protein
MRKEYNEFLPRRHPAKYGTRDKSNWKDLRHKSNWKKIDLAITPLIQLLNARGFKTFSSCSGGHKRNLNHPEVNHERGYVAFFPATGLVYNLYYALRKKHKEFELTASTVSAWEKEGSKWLETSEFRWQLKWNELSRRVNYYRFFDDTTSVVKTLNKRDIRPVI